MQIFLKKLSSVKFALACRTHLSVGNVVALCLLRTHDVSVPLNYLKDDLNGLVVVYCHHDLDDDRLRADHCYVYLHHHYDLLHHYVTVHEVVEVYFVDRHHGGHDDFFAVIYKLYMVFNICTQWTNNAIVANKQILPFFVKYALAYAVYHQFSGLVVF